MEGMVAALYRRYRPETFAEMIGQQQVTDPLSVAIRSGRINHAYLFSGPRGCGKTSSARILARCLNCAEGPTPEPCGKCESCLELGRDGGGSLDVLEIDAASHGGVDDARELRERAVMAPSRDRYRIFIIDEAHMVTSQGFNALLKVVEEPPEHVIFVFATTEPEKVIGTIRSRTHHYPFRLIPPAPMLEYLERICAAEGISAEAGVLPLVVRAGGGSARDTLSLLDQLIAGTEGETMQYQLATQVLGFTAQELLDETIAAFADGDAAAAYRSVDSVIQSGQDPRRFVEDLLERVRDLIVVKAIGQGAEAVLRGISTDDLERMHAAAARFTPRALSGMADAVNSTLSEMTGVTAPRVQLELMIARVLVAQRAAFAEGEADAVERPGQEAPAPRETSGRPDAGARETPSRPAPERPAPERPAPERPTPERPAAGERPAAEQRRTPQRRTEPETEHEVPKISAVEAAKAAWATPGVAAGPSTDSGNAGGPSTGSRRGPSTGSRTEAVEPQRRQESADPNSPAAAPSDQSQPAASGPSTSSGNVGGTSTSAGSGKSEPDESQVQDAWPSVLETVNRLGGRSTWSIVRVLQPLGYADGILSLWFPNRAVFDQARQSRDRQPSPSDHLKHALQEVFGVEMKIAPKIERSQGREQSAPTADAPPAQGDEDRHRGRSGAPQPSALRQAQGSSAAPAAAATWNVAPIPGEPRVADDGPGSAWDEYATGPAPSAPAPEEGLAPEEIAPVDEAPAVGPASAPERAASVPEPETHSIEEVAATAASELEREAAPVEMPEVTLHATPAAEVNNPVDEPAPPQAQSPTPATPSWNVVTVPGSEPDAPAEPEPEPEPEEPAGPKHPALAAGQERYGESVIREKLGARFVGEELRAFAGPEGPIEEAPDDFEAPPEEY